MMETGLTLVTNAAKHNTPMANVARLNARLISAPVPFPFARMQRLSGRLHFLDTSRRDDPFDPLLPFSMRVLNAAFADSSGRPQASCCRSDLP